MSFPLAPAQLQENPRAASSSCRRAGACGSLRRVPSSRVAVPPEYQSQKWEIGATLLPLPFHCVPNSHGKNGTERSLLVRAPGSAVGRRALPPETWPPLGKGLLRVRPLVSRCPRCSEWDRALGGWGSCSARLLLVIVIWGGKLFLDFLHGWWTLPGWRSHGKGEGPLSRVFLKALPYF